VLPAAALKNRYAEGEGVPQDLVEAYKWGLVAGAQGDPTTSNLNLSELAGKLTPEQLASHSTLAVWWFRQAEDSLRRDAANHTPEACAPHLRLPGYG
jgi:TPR repeat protein